jgi:hypothetical protein
LLIVFLLQLQLGVALDPFAGSVLHNFPQTHVAFADLGYPPVVLTQVVAHLDLVEQLVDPHQRHPLAAAVEAAHHGHGVQRKSLERLLAPIELGRDQRVARALDAGLAPQRLRQAFVAERISRRGLGVVLRHVFLGLGQGRDLGHHLVPLLGHPLPQVLLRRLAAAQQGGHATSQDPPSSARHHFLAPGLAAAFCCAVISSGSR